MLTTDEATLLRDRTADLVGDWYVADRGDLDHLDEEGLRVLVAAAALVQQESGFALQRWVSAARRAGVSWEQLGGTLGVSRQAAQQRFGQPVEQVPEQAGEKQRTPVTAFNEVDVLREEGAAGNEVVRAGWARLWFRPVGHPVENVRRVSVRSASTIAEMTAQGWTHVFSWYPYTYYTRAAA